MPEERGSGGSCLSKPGVQERTELAHGCGSKAGGLPGQTAELLQGLCSRSAPLHWVL